MAASTSPQAVLDEIAARPRGDDLARLVHTVAFAAADERRPRLEDGLTEAAERLGITSEDAETRYGNVLRALERGGAEAAGSATRVLLAALLARGVALSPPATAEAEARVGEALVWFATHTSIDALGALDAAMGDDAEGLWLAVASLVRRVDAGSAPLVGRAGALIAAAALRSSESRAARGEAKALAGEVRDPIIRSLLAESSGGAGGSAASAAGEIVAPPRNPIALVLLSPFLALLHLCRLIGRVALRYRRPAELRITARGVTVLAKTELLGRTLREREVHIPIEALLKASREVRYPRAAMYAGLFALALGSYFGISLFVDGARAGSPELLGIGLLLVGLGVALDFVLENVATTARGRCRVVIVPRKGQAVAIGLVDPASADAALGRLVRS